MIYTEWDPLKEIIVGKVYDPADVAHIEDAEFRNGLQRIFAESEEDFCKLTELLESYDVTVHRPDCKYSGDFRYPAVCPRDMHLVYDHKVINTIGGDPNRYYESDHYANIMLGLEGRDYYAMPRPLLPKYYAPYKHNEGKILYHAANILKCGDALIHTVPYNDDKSYPLTRQFGRGTDRGLQWIKNNVDARWIELHESGHADGKIALIKPGLLMCWLPDMIPPELKDWDYIQVPKQNVPEQFWQSKSQPIMTKNVKQWIGSWIGHVDETIFDVNVISINPELVITNGYDADVAAQLKRHGVEMIPFNFRHKFFWDSGLHCVTLDLTREGKRETYV
jgi:glycine amidinotransferase/scyllo-inosamine-4-phosphate amidinotransferase 1